MFCTAEGVTPRNRSGRNFRKNRLEGAVWRVPRIRFWPPKGHADYDLSISQVKRTEGREVIAQ